MSNVTVRARFDDRAHMEEAVHALLDEGVRKRAIQITRTSLEGHRVREGGSSMRLGGLVGGLLGGLAVFLAIVTLPTVAPFYAVLFRVLAAVVGGAMAGALAGLILSAIRDRRGSEDVGALDWLVRVRTDLRHASHVRGILTEHEGRATG